MEFRVTDCGLILRVDFRIGLDRHFRRFDRKLNMLRSGFIYRPGGNGAR